VNNIFLGGGGTISYILAMLLKIMSFNTIASNALCCLK